MELCNINAATAWGCQQAAAGPPSTDLAEEVQAQGVLEGHRNMLCVSTYALITFALLTALLSVFKKSKCIHPSPAATYFPATPT